MDIGWDKLREHLEPSHCSHRAITNGGDQPNVIPNKSSVGWFFCGATAEKIRALFEKAQRVAEGAANMTDTSYSVSVLRAVWPTRANRTLAEVIKRNVGPIGMPPQRATPGLAKREIGLIHRSFVFTFHSPPRSSTASSGFQPFPVLPESALALHRRAPPALGGRSVERPARLH